MKKMIVAALVLLSCSSQPKAPKISTKPQALLAPPTQQVPFPYHDPTNYGGTLNDGTDDRVATQAAIDAGCADHLPVFLPEGQLDIYRDFSGTGTSRIPSLRVPDGCNDLVITGTGPSSVLMAAGSGVRAGAFGPADWTLLGVYGDRLFASDFKMDGAARSNTGEQTHLLHLYPGADDATFVNLQVNLPILQPPQGAVKCAPETTDPDYATRMCHIEGTGDKLCKDLAGSPKCIPPGAGTSGIWPVSGWYSGGDCIRLLGTDNPGTSAYAPVQRTTFRNVIGLDCDRSCWGFQRAIYDTLLDTSSCLKVGDQAIDMEPTGVGTIRRTRVLGGTYNGMVTITGNGPDITDWSLGNVLDTVTVKRLFIIDAAYTQLRNLNITTDGDAPIGVLKGGPGLRIEGGRFERTGTGGPVISLAGHSGRYPVDVVIDGAHLIQRSDNPVLKGDPTQGLTVQNTTLECLQPTTNNYAAMLFTSVAAVAKKLRFINNDIRGTCKYGLQVQGSASGAGPVHFIGNIVEATTAAVKFDGGTPTSKPQITANTLLPSTLPVVLPATIQYVGAN